MISVHLQLWPPASNFYRSVLFTKSLLLPILFLWLIFFIEKLNWHQDLILLRVWQSTSLTECPLSILSKKSIDKHEMVYCAQHTLRVNCSSRSFSGMHVNRLPNTHTWPTHPQVCRLTHPSSSWLQHILSFSAASLDWDASVLTHITHSWRHTQ